MSDRNPGHFIKNHSVYRSLKHQVWYDILLLFRWKDDCNRQSMRQEVADVSDIDSGRRYGHLRLQ